MSVPKVETVLGSKRDTKSMELQHSSPTTPSFMTQRAEVVELEPKSPQVVVAVKPMGKYPQVSESGKTGSSYKKKMTIHTCCGVVELTTMKMACMIGMLVTAVGLLGLAAIAIYSFTVSERHDVQLLVYYGSARASAEAAIAVIVKATYSSADISQLVLDYNNYWNQLVTAMNGIFQNLEPAMVAKFTDTSTMQVVDNLRVMNSQILFMIKNNQKDDAVNVLESEKYSTNKTSFMNGIVTVLDYVSKSETDRNTRVIVSSSVQLLLIGISLVVILPILVFVFAFAINRDSLNMAKIRKANAIMLMDTMEDEGLRQLFKVHCDKEQNLENFLLMEKIQHYRTLCEKAVDLFSRMDNESSETMSDMSGSSGKRRDASLEKEYYQAEAKKYEVAFEIFTEFMDVTGSHSVNISTQLTEKVKQTLDKFNNKEIDTLPEDMFNTLEKETCIVMLDPHHRFKQSLAFQREMKIDKIKVEQLKKKKKVDF